MGIDASLSRAAAALAVLALAACGQAPARDTHVPAPALPPVSGTLAVDGVSAAVEVVRDRWGVPHITAGSRDDLFFAQGFVQAQDRLFQMDLWRRSVQGRLAEVLGANFIERDAMTRRIQYRGELDPEWTSYGDDVRAIATAFVRGVNAWVRLAREELPEEFVLAGWSPELWEPEDLLNRTDAFTSSDGAIEELLASRLAVALGPVRAGALLGDGTRLSPPAGLDLAIVDPGVGALLRRVGTPPFFLGLAAPVPEAADGGSNAWVIASSRSENGAPLLAADPHRELANPSLRYLVHLRAPGWHVAGATAPWMPGVAIGHSESVAWAWTTIRADTQDLYLERLNPDNPSQYRDGDRWVDFDTRKEAVTVKGRSEPFEYEQQFTSRGVVMAVDRARHFAYVLRWVGAEPGAAVELAALAINRAASAREVREALGRWKLPVADFVYADVEGRIQRLVAGVVPVRRGRDGRLPAPGWTGRDGWSGATRPDREQAARVSTGSLRDVIAVANDSVARRRRIEERLGGVAALSREDVIRVQLDTTPWNAAELVPLLARVRAELPAAEDARKRLLAWDRQLAVDSIDAGLYVAWERALRRLLAESRLPPDIAADFHAAGHPVDLAGTLTRPSSAWFDGDARAARDRLLVAALARAIDERRGPVDGSRGENAWGALNEVLFAHPLALGERGRQRLNVGPFQMPGYEETVFSVRGGAGPIGPSFRMVTDLADWDRTLVTNAPGQSGSPGSPHFRDLAASWRDGQYFQLAFSEAAVAAVANSTLTLVPR